MDDRQLLEAAARAAEMTDLRWSADSGCMCSYNTHSCSWYTDYYGDKLAWNPLTSDGDALRLAVQLRLHVNWGASIPGGDTVFVDDQDQELSDDPMAATRRAIVRAAARMAPPTVKDSLTLPTAEDSSVDEGA